MRISTYMMTQNSLNSMLEQQTSLSQVQLQISTGRRIVAPSDDPYGSSRSLNLNEAISINEKYSVNGDFADIRLSTTESAMDGLTVALQRVREQMIYGSNDALNAESRKAIREEVVQLLDQILDLANTTDSSGEYLFSGYQGNKKPFAPDGAGNFLYSGDDGQRYVRIGTATEVAVSDSGKDVFMDIMNGNGVFRSSQDITNTGSGVIGPGSVTGVYLPYNYQVKFLPPSSGLVTAPQEYYVVNTDTLEVIAAGSGTAASGSGGVYANEAAFLAAVGGGTDTGIPYESGAAIQGLDLDGMLVELIGEPDGGTVAATPQDVFNIAPSEHQNIFATIQTFINTLTSPQTSQSDDAAFHNAMNRSIIDIDQNLSRILEVRARIGGRLQTVGRQQNINETFNLEMKKNLSDIQDLDYAEAITNLNLQLQSLQAAQNTYSKIQGLSLFNFL